MSQQLKEVSAILRAAALCEYLGVSRTTVWKLEQTDPAFPRKVVFSSRCVGWRRADIDAYLAAKAGC